MDLICHFRGTKPWRTKIKAENEAISNFCEKWAEMIMDIFQGDEKNKCSDVMCQLKENIRWIITCAMQIIMCVCPLLAIANRRIYHLAAFSKWLISRVSTWAKRILILKTPKKGVKWALLKNLMWRKTWTSSFLCRNWNGGLGNFPTKQVVFTVSFYLNFVLHCF